MLSVLLFEQYNLQADMTRRQLEYEAQRVRELMTEDLGTSEQIAQRHEARLQRIRMIETEMLRLQQRHREQVLLAPFIIVEKINNVLLSTQTHSYLGNKLKSMGEITARGHCEKSVTHRCHYHTLDFMLCCSLKI